MEFEQLEELFDSSQYCTLDGGLLMSPEDAESDINSKLGEECEEKDLKSDELDPNTLHQRIASNVNMFGNEFFGAFGQPSSSVQFIDDAMDYYNQEPVRRNPSFNLPAQSLATTAPTAFYSSWRAVPGPSSSSNAVPQLDPTTGLPRKICSNCGSISTPSWRRCPEGRNLLCNACGLYQKLHKRPRPLRIREDGSVQVIRNLNSVKNTCFNCKTAETPIWRRSQHDRSLLLCNACALYLKTRQISRDAAKSEALVVAKGPKARNIDKCEIRSLGELFPNCIHPLHACPQTEMNHEWSEVKKDWVYLRKKTFIFKSWQPRYMVLYSRPCPALALYEQRSDSVPPYAPILHLELTANLVIDRWGHRSAEGESFGPSSMASSFAASRHPADSRRTSITSLVSDVALLKSKKHAEENALVILRPESEHHPYLKLVVAASSPEERDDWIAQMKNLISDTSKVQELALNSSLNAPLPSQPKHSKSFNRKSDENSGLSCLGVTIVKESKLTKLQANQPAFLSNSSSSDTDSLLNEISVNIQKTKLVEDVFPEEYIAKYYQGLKFCNQQNGSRNDSIKTKLQLFKILARFHDDVLKYVRLIIDDYHRKVPVNTSASYEFGPIRISLLPGYLQNDETIIEYTNSINRQELHVIRWINETASDLVNAMIVTCVEYKGFRFSAYLDVPLGANTVTLDLCPAASAPNPSSPQIVLKDEALDELNNIGRALRLVLPTHVRLGDGRSVSITLPPSVELHRLPRTVSGYPKGSYILNLSQIPPSWPVNPDNPLLCGLYRFRPEFLKIYPGQLSTADTNSEKSLAAFKFLQDEHLAAVLEELESLEQLPLDSLEWTEWLHGKGVNCVLLGKLASRARLPHVRGQLMVEMMARTVKRAIQSQLRGSILHFKEVQALRVEEELRAIVLHTLATIVGATPIEMQNYLLELLEAARFKFDFKIDLEALRHLPRPALFLAIQHHSGLQFVDRVYDFNLEAPFAKEDFLMFIPTVDKGPLNIGSNDFAYRSLALDVEEDEEAAANAVEEAFDETEALFQLGQQVLPLGEAVWQYPTRRAAVSRQFAVLSARHAQQRRISEASRYLDLARATCPQTHALRGLIELEAMRQRFAAFKNSNLSSQQSPAAFRDLMADLKRHQNRAQAEIEAHFGPHHPLLISIHQQAAHLYAQLSPNPAALQESLRARQNALAAATKALGRIHKWTRAQVLKIGDVNRSLGNLDEALSFYQDAFKSAQQCSAGPVVSGSICLSISACQQEKGDLDEALITAKRARDLLEDGIEHGAATDVAVSASSNMPRLSVQSPASATANTVVSHFSSLHDLLERTYQLIADLAQKVYADVHEDSTTFLSDVIQNHLVVAIECYEKLFDGIRQKPEIDGSKLLAVLKQIVQLKLRLARPSQKILINSIKSKKGANNAVSQAHVSECIMRIVASPSASTYMDRVLEKLEKPNVAANLGLGNNTVGEAKEVFDEISCVLQIVEF